MFKNLWNKNSLEYIPWKQYRDNIARVQLKSKVPNQNKIFLNPF